MITIILDVLIVIWIVLATLAWRNIRIYQKEFDHKKKLREFFLRNPILSYERKEMDESERILSRRNSTLAKFGIIATIVATILYVILA